MHITDLLKHKLKTEILHQLSQKYDGNQITHTKKIYKKICNKKIESKIVNITFLSDKSKDCNLEDNKRCCARIWDNHYGSRCKYKKYGDDYCKHHLNMIKRNGKLLFNRYDDDKPLINEKNNRIPWISVPEIEILNRIIVKQWLELEKQIKNDLKKQRYIAPKI